MDVTRQEERGFLTGRVLISDIEPSASQRVIALWMCILLVTACIASLPFRHVQLVQSPQFVLVLDAVLFIVDLVTAALLYAHFAVTGSRPLLVLATGYLFTSFIIVAHGLTFPGGFTPDGLLGATVQSSNYLQIFWRAGLPVAAVAYALARRFDRAGGVPAPPARSIFSSILLVLAAVVMLTLLVTLGDPLLPNIMVDAGRRIWPVDAPIIIPLEIAATLLVWRNGRSALDLWLLLVLVAWLVASILVSLTIWRFSLVWYESRAVGLLAASLVLVGLLVETTSLYGRLALLAMQREHERQSRLHHVDAVLSVAAHELNQPLSAIALNASTAKSEISRDVPDLVLLREIFNDVSEDAARASRTLSGLRQTFGRTAQERVLFDLRQVAAETFRLLNAKFSEWRITAELAVPDRPHVVSGNPAQIQQVLVNLISNAAESMAATRGKRLWVWVGRVADEVVVQVRDEGSGVDPAVGDGVFDPFVSSKGRQGGLGLPICRAIVETHGGRIWYESAAGGGAIFSFSLPLASGAST
ncbi:integral membrane sensor signal transduction histidine kinase [Bradyrhizobium lupini HPC(L)]|uniref:histidine kinase n=1 Tax=Bradyrhizobium lupini HPC(L) TaxID=1229491 RepID=A0ABN0HKA8_RHILU|nr:integral membrane sensor signal transduction histidine kinase [Bradyrhizobium lupini HPC(L)]